MKKFCVPIALALALLAVPALAATGDPAWIAPGIKVIDTIVTGLKAAAAAVFVAAVAGFGMVTYFTGRFDFQRLATIVGGGLLVSGAALFASVVFEKAAN